MPTNNDFYLISQDLAKQIWDKLELKYNEWPPAGTPNPKGVNIPKLIEDIQTAAPGSSVEPIDLSGTSILKVWVGTLAQYNSPDTVKSATTLYIITDGNS